MLQLMQFLGLKCEEFCEQDHHKIFLYMHEKKDGWTLQIVFMYTAY